MGGKWIGRGAPLEATVALLGGAFIREVKPAIEAALDAGADLSADAALLFAALGELGDEAEELALRVLDRHVPSGWDDYVATLIADIDSKNRDRRRAAARLLMHVAGGRIGARYRSTVKPNLERPEIWPALLRCAGHSDNVLRKKIASSLSGIAHRADDFEALVPGLVALLDGPSRHSALAAIGAAAKHGRDVSDALAALGDADDARRIWIIDLVRRGELAAALRRFEANPSSGVVYDLQSVRWPDMSGAIRFLSAVIDRDDVSIRHRTCEALGRFAAQGAELGPGLDRLAERLGDEARAKLAGQVGIYAAAALAAAARNSPRAAALLASGLEGKAAVARHAGFGLAKLACTDPAIDLATLLDGRSAKARSLIYGGVASGARDGGVERVAELLIFVDDRLSNEHDKKARDSAFHAIDNLCNRLRRIKPGGAAGLVALARRRWDLAREIGVYDDSKSIKGVAKINRYALETDPEHRGARALARELDAALAAAIT